MGRLAWERSRLQSSLNACTRLLLDAADPDSDSDSDDGDDEKKGEGKDGESA